MRESLYRGIMKESKSEHEELNWAFGNMIKELETGRCFISDLSYFDNNTKLADVILEVDPETVCQYTGLTDKNGRKIFEGDICEFSAYGENYKGVVRFIKGNFTIWCGKCAPFLDDALEKHSAVVIGNIFDNPELMS